MMINALNHILEIEHELITFSDDMDGLRKVPDNIPNSEILKENLGKPLTSIPDPSKNLIVLGNTITLYSKTFLKNLIFNLISKALLRFIKKEYLTTRF